MKRLARLAGVMTIAVLTACETTGNPREGGLFGWSEGKAQERQVEKRAGVAGAEARLTQETERGEALQTRSATVKSNLATAEKRRSESAEDLRAERAELVAKTEQLEADSPTAATASRARSYRLKVNTIAAQTSLTLQERRIRLRALEAEIDAALARLTR